METKEILSTSAEETAHLGRDIAEEVKDGGIVCLYGDLGSGKTTFTQGFAKALGIDRSVNSPTFLIVRTYQLDNNEQKTVNKKFYHIDLYRLESEQDMEGIGIQEIMDDPENVVVIEWSEKLGNLLPEKRIDIKFEYVDEEKRKIRVTRLH